MSKYVQPVIMNSFFYYVMMGLTCHKPHKRHGSLLNRVPLMYTSASLKRSGESVSPLDSNKKTPLLQIYM